MSVCGGGGGEKNNATMGLMSNNQHLAEFEWRCVIHNTRATASCRRFFKQSLLFSTRS